MATAVRRFGASAYRISRSKPQVQTVQSRTQPSRPRPFSTTLLRRRPSDTRETRVSSVHFAKQLRGADRDQFDNLSPEERREYQLEHEEFEDAVNSRMGEAELTAEINRAARESAALTAQQPERDTEKSLPGFMAMGEEGEFTEREIGPDDDFMGDDMTSTGHAELEQHRELREYARITAWEMPLLSKLAKPFVPPSKDQPLRFRTTDYMGETHPAAHKVVLEFCAGDLPNLTDEQRAKLIKLVGVRYNPDTDIVKMSCELFDEQAQNKRYLSDLVDTLLTEARDPTDTLADIPFDFRHHRPRPKPRFPPEWRMTPERRQYLDEKREQTLLLEQRKAEAGTLLDGTAVLENAYATLPAYQVQEEVVAPKRPGPGLRRLKGKGVLRR
ncbi:MAG: 37S ribosomal protein S24, mitochondrial [Piccolia ochrophora]|nr:MAG: 37S ribosomal protein S24, mitochondrial [Piccolia ochrophora]